MSEFLAERIPWHYRHFLIFSKCQFCILHFIFVFSQNGKESACNVGNLGSIPGLERSPGEGKGNPLQYSCPENPMDRGAW